MYNHYNELCKPYFVITIYVRTDGWLIIRLKKVTGDFFKHWNSMPFCDKTGAYFLYSLFRVKFIHLIPLPKYKISDFMKIEGACHPVISVKMKT